MEHFAARSLSESYAYQPLASERETRLIQLVPDDTQPHGFSLKLEAFRLDGAPPYCTLSYTWKSAIVPHLVWHGNNGDDDGDDDNETPVMVDVQCDGRRLPISTNGFQFLCYAFQNHFFLPDGAGGGGGDDSPSFLPLGAYAAQLVPKYVWIDAISIDQSNLDERSHQVLIMGDIYQLCSTTIVWLGNEDPHPGAQWVLQTFAPRFLDLFRSRGYEYLMGMDSACTDAALVGHFGQDVCSRWAEEYKHFLLFLIQHRWFYRGWVVQEVVLKSLQTQEPEDVAVVCGSCTTPWCNLAEFVQALHRTDWRRHLMRRLRSDPSLGAEISASRVSLSLQRISTLNSFQRRLGNTGQLHLLRTYGSLTANERLHTIFFDTLHHMRHYHFSDTRDAVYGSFGLVSSTVAPNTSGLKAVPNYRLSVADVYIDAAWAILRNMPYLDLLGTARGDLSMSCNFPSWVPDFSVRSMSVRLSSFQYTFRAKRRFDASKARSPVSAFLRVDKKKIVLQGVRLYTVEQEGPELSNYDGFQVDYEWFLELLSLYDAAARYPHTEEPPDEALCRTLVGDTFRLDLRETEHAAAFRAWWSKWLAQRIRDQEEQLPGSGASLMNLLDRQSLSTEWLPSLPEVLDAVHNRGGGGGGNASSVDMVIHRLWLRSRFFVTADGRFGIGSEDVASGDEVWLLKGGRAPLVLRAAADGSGYRNVGEAYVHGVMYGEAATEETLGRMRAVMIY